MTTGKRRGLRLAEVDLDTATVQFWLAIKQAAPSCTPANPKADDPPASPSTRNPSTCYVSSIEFGATVGRTRSTPQFIVKSEAEGFKPPEPHTAGHHHVRLVTNTAIECSSESYSAAHHTDPGLASPVMFTSAPSHFLAGLAEVIRRG
jgi:hypothetical protein